MKLVMKKYPPLFLWLVAAALVDWLVLRTLTRLAIFMPKPPIVISIYQIVTGLGQIASTLAGLLTIAALFWMAWKAFARREDRLLASTWVILIYLSILFLFVQAQAELAVANQLILGVALVLSMFSAWNGSIPRERRFSVILPALALFAGVIGRIAQLAQLPLSPAAIFQVGEIFAVLTPVLLWWVYSRRASLSVWLVAALPAVAFTTFRLFDPATAGILAIWSTGMTLFLPWPVYTLSLWLGGVMILASRREAAAGAALLLLASGGLAPQLSHQVFMGLIGLRLLGLIMTGRERSIVQDATGSNASLSSKRITYETPRLPASIARQYRRVGYRPGRSGPLM